MCCQKFGSFLITQMPDWSGYPFFQELRIISIPKHFIIIIGFKHQMIRLTDVFTDFLIDMADIGCNCETMLSILYIIPDTVGTVVRNRECCYFKIPDKEWDFFLNDPLRGCKSFFHIPAFCYSPVNTFGCIYRNTHFFSQITYRLNVVCMVVCDQDSHNLR